MIEEKQQKTIEDKLIPKSRSAIIKRKGMDLQLFGERKPKARIEGYIQQRRHWKKGDDPRLLNYSEEAVKKALYYYKKELGTGIIAPDGMEITITEDDFYKIIKDFRLLKKPSWIKEILINSKIKIEQQDGRYVYFSYNPSGYVATGEITYSCHYFGKKGQESVQKMIESKLKSGGELVWEKS